MKFWRNCIFLGLLLSTCSLFSMEESPGQGSGESPLKKNPLKLHSGSKAFGISGPSTGDLVDKDSSESSSLPKNNVFLDFFDNVKASSDIGTLLYLLPGMTKKLRATVDESSINISRAFYDVAKKLRDFLKQKKK